MSCEQRVKDHKFGFFMFLVVMLFSISFVAFIEHCPLGISLWTKLGEFISANI